MKTKRKFIYNKVNNRKEAIQYLTELAFSDIQYHLDENARNIVWDKTVNKPTKEECLLLDQRNKECREVLVNDIFDFYYPLSMEGAGLKAV